MSGWYDTLYAGDPATDNPFGRDDLADRDNRALLSHTRAGGSLLDFPRHVPSRTPAQFIQLMDRVLGIPNAIR